MFRPSGTVTFLFTDVEGSTRRWESDADAMRVALAAHDEVLRAAIEAHDGWLFKHTGDGVCAAFSLAGDAVAAAIEAQLQLALPVRMGIGTGSAQLRGEDYFGPALNRAARVMAAGHGGQILVAASTAALADGFDLADLGEHRLRDLSGVHRLFQVRAPGLGEVFAALRTVDAVPGNLPVLATSFIGRDAEVKELTKLVREHRMVTLTGVGGVGKTRLALQVAAELSGEFPDGVWLVELASVGDPAAVPDAVATALGVTPRAGLSVTENVARALSGRSLLLVLDNCEHVLDEAAGVAAVVLAFSPTPKILAASREGLRVGGERAWTVPSLDTREGPNSAAVALFIERAQAANSEFALRDDRDVAAVVEICGRLDGIALAIELAAARMVSMSPVEVRDRLGDRFRLLSGGRRGVERHRTLRDAVAWSYDLLDATERSLLNRCSVFAGGFDLGAAARLNDGLDEYAVLDGLDSLVRKSLVTVEHTAGHIRYGMLETVRQFAEELLTTADLPDALRDGHAAYFAERAVAQWELWDGPGYRAAVDWADAEFANLRLGFRWAADHQDWDTATAIAAHTAMLTLLLQRFEAVGWVEEILPAATEADVRQLSRLFSAAGLCSYLGRPDDALRYAKAAVALEADPCYDSFVSGWSSAWECLASVLGGGDLDRWLEISWAMIDESGFAHAQGLCMVLYLLPAAGRSEEAVALAEEALLAAKARGNPYLVAFAMCGYGRAYLQSDPQRALESWRQGLVYTREHRVPFYEANIARDLAGLEAVHGDLGQALDLFYDAVDVLHRAGDVANLASTFANLAIFYDTIGEPAIAAALHGASTRHGDTSWVINLPRTLDHLRTVLGATAFAQDVSFGANMEAGEAVAYARQQIRTTGAAHGQPTN